MSQSKRPKGLQLRKAPRTTDYGQDVGYMHRGDYAWWIAGRFHLLRAEGLAPSQSIGRYLDGEEEREGLYR